MSRNAAQPGVEPDGHYHGSTAAAIHLVESAIGPLPIDIDRGQAGRHRFVCRISNEKRASVEESDSDGSWFSNTLETGLEEINGDLLQEGWDSFAR